MVPTRSPSVAIGLRIEPSRGQKRVSGGYVAEHAGQLIVWSAGPRSGVTARSPALLSPCERSSGMLASGEIARLDTSRLVLSERAPSGVVRARGCTGFSLSTLR